MQRVTLSFERRQSHLEAFPLGPLPRPPYDIPAQLDQKLQTRTLRFEGHFTLADGTLQGVLCDRLWLEQTPSIVETDDLLEELARGLARPFGFGIHQRP